MEKLSLRKIVVVAVHALVIWALCGALLFASLSLMPLGYALVLHVIGAPVMAA